MYRLKTGQKWKTNEYFLHPVALLASFKLIFNGNYELKIFDFSLFKQLRGPPAVPPELETTLSQSLCRMKVFGQLILSLTLLPKAHSLAVITPYVGKMLTNWKVVLNRKASGVHHKEQDMQKRERETENVKRLKKATWEVFSGFFVLFFPPVDFTEAPGLSWLLSSLKQSLS